MTRPHRICLATASMIGIGLIVACGGGGKPGRQAIPTIRDSASSPSDDGAKSKAQLLQSSFVGDATEGGEVERELTVESLRRREALRPTRNERAAALAKEEAKYRLAKAELEAARKLTFYHTLILSSDEHASKGNNKEAARLEGVARAECDEIVSRFPDTQAASDARELRGGKRLPTRPLPADLDEAKNIPPRRLCGGDRSIDLAAIEDWGAPLEGIPATLVDKGVLKDVPYRSFRAGEFEFNIYGDPDLPACVEIGFGKTESDGRASRDRCVAFLASLLTDAGDRSLLKTLNLAGADLKVRAGLTFEVTPETAPDAYGRWWVSVYSRAMLDKSRATPQELAAITAPRKVEKESPATPWTSQQLTRARPGAVIVRGYHRKDGTYVPSHTRSAPSSSKGGGKR